MVVMKMNYHAALGYVYTLDNVSRRQENASGMQLSTKEIGVAQILFVSEIAPKSSFLCLNSAVLAQKLSGIV